LKPSGAGFRSCSPVVYVALFAKLSCGPGFVGPVLEELNVLGAVEPFGIRNASRTWTTSPSLTSAPELPVRGHEPIGWLGARELRAPHAVTVTSTAPSPRLCTAT